MNATEAATWIRALSELGASGVQIVGIALFLWRGVPWIVALVERLLKASNDRHLAMVREIAKDREEMVRSLAELGDRNAAAMAELGGALAGAERRLTGEIRGVPVTGKDPGEGRGRRPSNPGPAPSARPSRG